MRKSLLHFSILAVSLTVSSAFSAEGMYFSAGIGHSTVENMPSAETYGYYDSNLDATSTAFRAALGYSKDLNPSFGFGAELGYNNYGKQTYEAYTVFGSNSTLEYKYSSVDLLGKFTWHVSKAFDLYAKLGIANEMSDISGDTDISSDSQVLPEIGLGLSYFATEKLSFDLAMYRTEGDDVQLTYDDANNLPSILTVLFGVSYYFS